jgi:hypothetical protein
MIARDSGELCPVENCQGSTADAGISRIGCSIFVNLSESGSHTDNLFAHDATVILFGGANRLQPEAGTKTFHTP